MAGIKTVQTNFASGELDPLMRMRVDTGAFQNGAAELTNAALFNTGGVGRRPGTSHLAQLTGRVRLIPFEFSASERYVLAFSAGRLDVYTTTGTLLTSVTSGCNWTAGTLFSFTYAQAADTMIVAHQGWQPQLIRRTGASSFTVSNFAFETSNDGNKVYQPYYKFTDDAVTLAASAITGSVTLTASAALFTAGMVGQRIRWHDTEIELTGYTSATSATGTVKGRLEATFDLNPFRTTTGSTAVEVTHVAHGFATGASVTLSGANNVGGVPAAQLSGTFFIAVIDDNTYSIGVTTAATESIDGGGPNVKWSSATTATRNWAEPTFSTERGWPGAVCFHEGRLWFAGSTGVPDGLWSSQIYRYFNFDVGEGLDNESIQVTVGSDDISNVRHIVSHRDLQIFTANSEFYAPSPNSSTLTPATMKVSRQTPYGAGEVGPLPFDGATLFLQASGTAVREYVYNDGSQGYAATNISVLAGHLLSAPHDMAVQYGSSARSEQYCFVVNSDGTLAVFHSARAEQLAGWTRWSMSGGALIDAVCVIGGDVFFSVKRGATYFLEKLATDRLHTLDGAAAYTSVTAKTDWTVGSLFFGKTVHVVSGNYYLGEFTVGGSGALTLPVAVEAIAVGYSYPFRIRTLPVHIQLANGPMTGRPKRIVRVIIGLDTTLSVSLSGNRLILRQVDDDFSVAPEPFSGSKEFFLLGYSRDAEVTVTQEEPLACAVLGMVMEVNV